MTDLDFVPLGRTPLAPLPRAENHPRRVSNGLQRALEVSLEEHGPFAENEIRPLAFAPGWWAARAPDIDHGGATENTIVCMREHVVLKRIGFLPERPLMLEQPDGIPSR